MAIGNQLDLNIVVNGFNQAQQALERLSGAFGSMGQNAVNLGSSSKNLSQSMITLRKELLSQTGEVEKSQQGWVKLTDRLKAVEGGGDRTGETFRDVAQAMQQAEQAQTAFTLSIIQATTNLGQLVWQLGTGVIGTLRGSAIEMEQLKIQLKTIGRASEDTTKSLGRLVKISRLPGIDFQQAVKGVTQLRATGVSAQLAEQAISNLGNALASVGADPNELSGVVRAFSQIQSKGKVYAEEIYQIAERLPQIRTIMLETIGTADTELLAKEGYSANQFLKLVTQGLSQLPRVAENTKNELSNLKNEVFLMTASIGKQLLPIISGLTKWLSKVVKWIDSWSDGMKKWVGIGAIVTTIVGGLITIFGTLATIIVSLVLLFRNLSASATVNALKIEQLAFANLALGASQKEVTAGAVAQSVAMATLGKTAKVTTTAIKGTTLAMRAFMVLSGIGIALVIGSMILEFINLGKKLKKTKTGMDELGESVQKTNELMGKFVEINRLTKDIKSQTLALNDLKTSYEGATQALKDHKSGQKGNASTTEEEKKETKSQEEILANRIRATDQNVIYGKENLQSMKERMIQMIKDLPIENIFRDFVGVNPSGKGDFKGKMDLKFIENEVTKFVTDDDTLYNKWVESFRSKFFKRLKTDEKNLREKWSKLTQTMLEKQSVSRSKTSGISAKDINLQGAGGMTFNNKDFGKIIGADDKGLGGQIEEIVMEGQTGVFNALSEALFGITGNLSERVDTDVLEVLRTRMFEDGKKMLNISKELNTGLFGDGKEGTHQIQRLIAQLSETKIDDKNVLEGIAIFKDARGKMEDLQSAYDKEDVFDEEGRQFGGGQIRIIAKTFGDLIRARLAMDVWITQNLAEAKLDTKDRGIGATVKAMQEIRKSINNVINNTEAETSGADAQSKSIYKQIQALQNAMGSLTSGRKPMLVTKEIQRLEAGLAQEMSNETLRMTKALNTHSNFGSTIETIYKAYGSPTLNQSVRGEIKTKDQMLDIIKAHSQAYQIEAGMRGERIKKLGELSTKGLNSLVKILITEYGVGTSDEKAGGMNALARVIENLFMKDGQFSDEAISSLNNVIEANRIADLPTTPLGADQQDLVKGWKLVDKISNPAEIYTIAQEFIKLSAGGSERLMLLAETMAKSEAMTKERLIQEIEERQAFQQVERDLMVTQLQVLDQGYGQSIALAIAESTNIVMKYQDTIDKWITTREGGKEKQINQLKNLISIEEGLLQTRIDTIVKEEETIRQKEVERGKGLKLTLSGLKEQEILSKSVDPEAVKLARQDLKYREASNILADKKQSIIDEHYDAEQRLALLEEEKNPLYDEILTKMDSASDYARLIQDYQYRMNGEIRAGIPHWENMEKVNELIRLQILAQKDGKMENVDLDKQILTLNYQINKAMANQVKRIKEREGAIKRTSELAKIELDISLQGLKNRNRDGKNNLAIILKEYEIKEQQRQLDEKLAYEAKNRMMQQKNANEAELRILKTRKGEGQFGKVGQMTLKDLNDRIDVLTLLKNINLEDTEQWRENQHEIAKVLRMFGLLQAQKQGAINAEHWREAREELDAINDSLTKQLANNKRINKEVADQRSFSQDFGISADLFGFQNWEPSKFDSIKDEFKTFFTEGLDPAIITELKSMTQEYQSLKDQRTAIGHAEIGSEKEKKKLLADVTQKELDLYKSFNDNYRKYLTELKSLSQERFNNAKSHADQMLTLTEEAKMLDLESEYAGRKMTPELESQKLQKELDIKAKFIQDKYDLDNKELEQRRGMLKPFDYNKLTEDQRTWLRDKQTLNKETDNSYKKLENIAKGHNLRFSANATKTDKFNNKLGSKVLSYLDAREKRTNKHHASIETMEKKHQREMQKFLDQDGQTLKDKADKYAQAQFKYGEQIDALNQKHNSSQIKSRLDLEKALKSSHTTKGGLPVELQALMRDMKDVDEAEKLKLPKTKEDFLKMIKDYSMSEKVGVSGVKGKLGKWWAEKRGKESKYTEDDDGKWFKKVDGYRVNADTYAKEYYKSHSAFEGNYNKLKDLNKLKIFEGDETKIAETLASFAELKIKPDALGAFMQGIDNFDKIAERLTAKAKESVMTPLEEAEKRATDNMNKFSGQLLALSGENGNLPRFAQAIDAVTYKLSLLSMQMGGLHKMEGETIDAKPQIIKIESNINVTANQGQTVRLVNSGVTSGSESGAVDPFATSLAGGTGMLAFRDDSRMRNRNKRAGFQANTGNVRKAGAWIDVTKGWVQNV